MQGEHGDPRAMMKSLRYGAFDQGRFLMGSTSLVKESIRNILVVKVFLAVGHLRLRIIKFLIVNLLKTNQLRSHGLISL